MKNRMARNPRPISLCALVPYPPDTTPSQRYRIEQWRPYLEQEGISVQLFPFVDAKLMKLLHKPGHVAAKAARMIMAFAQRIMDVAAASHYDAILIHRAACLAGPAVLERALAKLRRPILFDFDDAIYRLHTSAANRRFGWLKFPTKTATLCRLSAHVIVGNSSLAEYASRFNPRATVIPPSVDTDRYRPMRKHKFNSRMVVGWTGSSTSQTHLEMFAPVLVELLARRDVEIRVISDRKPVLPGIPYTWVPWSSEIEIEELARLDIGIMPMPDDPWARGKCAMKALLYMAMGIPAICSAVGANGEVVQHGENGLLATTPEQWLAHLEALIDDPALREKLGAAGRQTVEERYSMRRCAALFARVVRQTLHQ
jgi:glycosyltransferase involved in cell wall biosynthesis